MHNLNQQEKLQQLKYKPFRNDNSPITLDNNEGCCILIVWKQNMSDETAYKFNFVKGVIPDNQTCFFTDYIIPRELEAYSANRVSDLTTKKIQYLKRIRKQIKSVSFIYIILSLCYVLNTLLYI